MLAPPCSSQGWSPCICVFVFLFAGERWFPLVHRRGGHLVFVYLYLYLQENAGSPLFIIGVVTFLISFSLPFILVGAFLLYSLCQQVKCSSCSFYRYLYPLSMLPFTLLYS